MDNSISHQPATPGADEEIATITLHIKCDPNLTNDDSDELVVHVLPEGRVMLEIYQGPGLGTNYVMTVLESIPAMQLKTFIGEMSYEHQKALVHISELESDLRFSADVNEKLDRVITHLEDGLKRIKTRSCFSECVNVADRVLGETREQLAAARTQCELRSAGHDDLRTQLNQANGQLNQLRAALAERDKELAKKQSLIETACRDWADDDTRIKEMVKHLIPSADVEGDSHGVPSILDCADMLCTEIESLRSQLQAATSSVLALEAQVGELREALELAAALPTHQLADPELLKVALAATDALAIEQPELPLIEEVSKHLEALASYYRDYDHPSEETEVRQLLSRLNPAK